VKATGTLINMQLRKLTIILQSLQILFRYLKLDEDCKAVRDCKQVSDPLVLWYKRPSTIVARSQRSSLLVSHPSTFLF